MSDTGPTTHVQNADLPELPDDFGKEVLARFARRDTTTAAPMNQDVPGGLPTELVGQQPWAQGTSVDASAQIASGEKFAAAAQQLARDIAAGVEPGGSGTEAAGEGQSTAPLPPPQSGQAAAEAPAPTETAQPTQTATDAEAQTQGELPAPTLGTEQIAPTEPSGYVWNYIDPATNGPAARRYDDAEVQQGLHLKAWADSLDPNLRDAFAAIEDGTAVPIPRAEFDRYWAWQQQQERGQRDADLTNIASDDPEIARMIQAQRDEIDQLRQMIGQQQQPAPYDNVNQNLDGFSQRFDAGVLAYMEQNKITEQEARQLVNQAVQSGIIGHLTQQYSQWNPATGKLMAAADPAIVAREALNWAIFRNPQFHQTVVSRRQQPAPALTGQPGQAVAPAPSNVTPITAKKARAASLATAPSAAVTPTPRPVTDLSANELVAGMAAFIDQAQAQ